MELSDYENYCARCEKEKMTLFIRNFFPKIECMKCISPSEIEKMGLSDLKEYIRSKTERICPNEQPIYIRLNMPDAWEVYLIMSMSISKTAEIEKDELLKMVTTKAEKTNVLRQQVYALKEIFEKSKDNMNPCRSTIQYASITKETYKNPSRNIKDYMDASDIADASYQVLLLILAAIDEWLESRKKLFIVLLAVLLLGNNDDCKRPARPDRGKISCITVYLLGNDGAHSYNGNGIRFTTITMNVRITDMERADQPRNAEPPSDVLLRQPTDREQATITRDVLLRQLTDRELATITRGVLLRQLTDRELATVTRDVLLRQPTDREQATITRDVLLRQPTDRELAKITRDVLLRQPTDRELATIAMKIGDEYVLLAAFLEIGRAELAHIREDNTCAVLRKYNMLLKWKENKGSNATIEKLADAVKKSGNNADIVYSSLDDAMI